MKISPLRDQISSTLRERIHKRELPPGSVLQEERLAAEFGVSRTPVREALQGLATESLLRKRERRGFEVCAPDSAAGSVGDPDALAESLGAAAVSAGRSAVVSSTLRENTASLLREKILANELKPGTILREATLSAQLGISRTPTREALLILTREGLTSKVPRRGFEINPLEVREVRELYPLRALLESEALRQSGIPGQERLEVLHRLNDELRRESVGAQWIHLDNQWHERLVEGCSNRHLQSFLELLRKHSLRYELAFLRAIGDSERSTGQHEEILRHLSAGKLDQACSALARNMTVSMAPLLDWLEARDSPSEL